MINKKQNGNQNQNQNNNLTTAPLPRNMCFNFEQLNIISTFQRLWTQVAVFMRAYIVSDVNDTPTAPYNAQRLLQMSSDFRNAMLLFYGPAVADSFNSLFTAFIGRPTNVVEGFKSNNQPLINDSVTNWYEDADNLANFLVATNLYWDEYQWRNLLYQYIQLKLQMITSVIAKDYQREIQIYDRVFDLTTIIGAFMAKGLIAQQTQNIQR